MRCRLRPMPTAEQLAQLYATPHQHTRWADHIMRANVTVAIGMSWPPPARQRPARPLVADLSCGDGWIARQLAQALRGDVFLGDYAPGHDVTGPIEDTVDLVAAGGRRVDLFVCSETIEHLDDPDTVLARIRDVSSRLLLSTPDGEADDSNPEHVWAWDAPAVEDMLKATGWDTQVHTTLDLRPAGFLYSFGIWLCE